MGLMTTSTSSTTVSASQFRDAFRCHPAGVALVTATDGGRHVAMTVSSLASVSADPPLVVFSVSDESSSADVLNRSASVVVHLLDADSAWLAKLGATHDVDRFGDPHAWTVTGDGDPYFVDAPTVLRSRVVERVRAGGSTLCVALAEEVITTDAAARPRPLVYVDRTWHALTPASTLG